MTNGKAFVDTNILLRATIVQFPLHAPVRKLVNDLFQTDTELWISRQVIREYLAHVTRPQLFMNPMSVEQVEAQLTIEVCS